MTAGGGGAVAGPPVVDAPAAEVVVNAPGSGEEDFGGLLPPWAVQTPDGGIAFQPLRRLSSPLTPETADEVGSERVEGSHLRFCLLKGTI